MTFSLKNIFHCSSDQLLEKQEDIMKKWIRTHCELHETVMRENGVELPEDAVKDFTECCCDIFDLVLQSNIGKREKMVNDFKIEGAGIFEKCVVIQLNWF